ncbi:Tab2/Atab2 family RNA-binding protein [Spirulina subsalsa FACHB-351]|uniref:Tab2/Atab2 family RNA-binding protein n=1 Tax=Spirulina subsalsa FACHB-351 TaxID=234711 RepID=A0ABT3L4L4_9CYAN|nr:Tab2/Atab2 family RNA-binding protein [Spirulina subsalsa]MCW6036392.1 Tab2/Atab2 family RNA-binding protein [Spirulina subsalsa FACHB-351]
MTIWQADFYKLPRDNAPVPRWELVVCDEQGSIITTATCPQTEASVPWLIETLSPLLDEAPPQKIQVFRPQSLALMEPTAQRLQIPLEATRKTTALKRVLAQRRGGDVSLEQPPPQPLPGALWGENWRFASLPAGDLLAVFCDRPLPILQIPDGLDPLALGLPSTAPIPGIIIEGGRRSMMLARWLEEVQPVAVNYVATEAGVSGGLVLEAGLVDRWILVTFEDREVAAAAELYQQRLVSSQGVHFLLVQPDNTGITYTGFWVLSHPITDRAGRIPEGSE